MAAGNDNGSINDVRNYSYRSWMVELSGQAEWNFVRTRDCIASLLANMKGRRGASWMSTRVYMFLGAGAVYSHPMLDTHGRSLSIGENTKKNAIGFVIPYGLGVRSDINSDWAAGFEIGRRYCTSDYLDGISTKWSKANDTYYFTTLQAIYKIQFVGSKRPPRPGRRR